MTTKHRWCIFLLLLLVLAFSRDPAWAQRNAIRGKGNFGTSVQDLQVQLKVQGITKENFYMGEVWVAPAKFTDIQMGEQYLGNARVVTFDKYRNPLELRARWLPSDPAMVKISLDKGNRVKFTVLKPGQCLLRVKIGRVTKELIINAVSQLGAMRVEIVQQDTP